MQGSTGTMATGPTHDHTTGFGFYLNAEISNENETLALLTSSTLTLKSDSNCATYWTHMWGSEIGTLRYELIYLTIS